MSFTGNVTPVPHTSEGERLASLECLRVAAIVGVISQHVVSPQLFQNPGIGVNFVMCLVEQVRVLAVPLFFLMSGYFFGNAIQAGKSATDVVIRYAKWFVPMWLLWSAIYAFLPPNWGETGHGVLRPMYWQLLSTIEWVSHHPVAWPWYMPPGHQWFLSALLVGLTTMALLHTFNFTKVALPVAVILYVTGVLLRREIFVVQPLPLSSYFTIEVAITLLFISSGWWISFHLTKPSLKLGVSLAVTGYLLAVFEAGILWHQLDRGFEQFTMGSPMMGTIPFALGIFLIALAKPNLGRSTFLPSLARLTFGVYMCHVIFVDLLNPLRVWLNPPILVWDLTVPFVVYLLAAGFTAIVSKHRVTNSLLVRVKTEPAASSKTTSPSGPPRITSAA